MLRDAHDNDPLGFGRELVVSLWEDRRCELLRAWHRDSTFDRGLVPMRKARFAQSLKGSADW